jgi:hypothetical protein
VYGFLGGEVGCCLRGVCMGGYRERVTGKAFFWRLKFLDEWF